MIETIIEKYGMNEQDEIEEFGRNLIEKIERSKELFFSYADFISERRENDEVKQREENVNREFDYKKSIFILLQKLSLIDRKERRELMLAVKNGIEYTIKGIYVYGLKDNSRGVPATLFADLVSEPHKYL